MQLFFRDIVVRPRESVSVGSLSLLLDFLPKVHGERGHGVGGQDDDGAAHELRGDAAPGREPHALPVQVRVCRLHGVREGLHASGREGALHFLFSDSAVVVPCHPRRRRLNLFAWTKTSNPSDCAGCQGDTRSSSCPGTARTDQGVLPEGTNCGQS